MKKPLKIFKFLAIFLFVLIAVYLIGVRIFPEVATYRGLFLIAISFDLGALLIIAAFFLMKKYFAFFPLLAGAVILINMFAPEEVSTILSPVSLAIGVIYYICFVRW